MRQLVFALMLVAGGSLIACQHSPAGPNSAVISGRWTGGGACLSVTDATCTLVVQWNAVASVLLDDAGQPRHLLCAVRVKRPAASRTSGNARRYGFERATTSS